jgi:hypothetical protein
MVDFPTPPLPEATQITFLTWASAPSGRRLRPRVCCRLARSSSERTSNSTATAVTPSSSATFWATACWKWFRIGQPGVVRDTMTPTLPSSAMSIERTIPSSTMLRRSSGSMTARSLSVTCSWVGRGITHSLTGALGGKEKRALAGPLLGEERLLFLLAR